MTFLDPLASVLFALRFSLDQYTDWYNSRARRCFLVRVVAWFCSCRDHAVGVPANAAPLGFTPSRPAPDHFTPNRSSERSASACGSR